MNEKRQIWSMKITFTRGDATNSFEVMKTAKY